MPRVCFRCWRYFRRYSTRSDIHGIRYIVEERSFTERIVWAIIVFASLACCVWIILALHQKFVEGPLVVSFDTRDTPVHSLPFPAITICSEIKTSEEFLNYGDADFNAKNNKYMSKMEIERYMALYFVCDNTEDWMQGRSIHNDDFYDHLIQMNPTIDEILELCEMWGKPQTCSEIFHPVLTDEGVCYTFNFLDKKHIFKPTTYVHGNFFANPNDSKHWNQLNGYKTPNPDTYPRRVTVSGAHHVLRIHLKMEQKDFDYECKSSLQGFRIQLHSPVEFPQMSKYFIRISMDKSLAVDIYPELLTTSKTVQDYSPDVRQCYLENEKILGFFKMYNQKNCLLECLTNYTLRTCGCVNFYMPRSKDTPVCGTKMFKCLKVATRQFSILELMSSIQANKREQPCTCLPLCTNLKYRMEISASPWNWRYLHNMSEEKRDRKSELMIYFGPRHILKLERNELVGLPDLIARYGGVLGLFIGVSMLSLVELCYFWSFRMCCNKCRTGKWTYD